MRVGEVWTTALAAVAALVTLGVFALIVPMVVGSAVEPARPVSSLAVGEQLLAPARFAALSPEFSEPKASYLVTVIDDCDSCSARHLVKTEEAKPDVGLVLAVMADEPFIIEEPEFSQFELRIGVTTDEFSKLGLSAVPVRFHVDKEGRLLAPAQRIVFGEAQ